MSRKTKQTSDWNKARSTGPTVGVDRKAEVIRGVIIAQEGPFKTEGRGEFDGQSLRKIIDLVQQAPNGLKSRFSHPTLSDDGLGKFVGRMRNVRLDTITTRESYGEIKHDRITVVRADLHIDPTSHKAPSGDLGGYVMDLAESDPDAFSTSLVLSVDKEFRLDDRGRPLTDASGNELPPLWRPTKLHASDVVDTGDAVDGFLSTPGLSVDGLPDAVVRQGVALLDRQFPTADRATIEARCRRWLTRYLNHRYGASSTKSTGRYDPSSDPALLRLQRRNAGRRRTLSADREAQQIRLRRRRGRPGLLPCVIEGYCLHWLSEGFTPRDGDEWFEAGCFAPTLDSGKEVAALLRHNRDDHLGSTAEGSLVLWPDTKGLWITLRPPANALGRRLVEDVRAGRLNGCSVAFRPIVTRDLHIGGGRYLTRIVRADLGEISLTDNPVHVAGRVHVRDL